MLVVVVPLEVVEGRFGSLARDVPRGLLSDILQRMVFRHGNEGEKKKVGNEKTDETHKGEETIEESICTSALCFARIKLSPTISVPVTAFGMFSALAASALLEMSSLIVRSLISSPWPEMKLEKRRVELEWREKYGGRSNRNFALSCSSSLKLSGRWVSGCSKIDPRG